MLWHGAHTKNLKEEWFFLAHGFRRVHPWLLNPVFLGGTSWWQGCAGGKAAYLMMDMKQREKKKTTQPLVTFFYQLGLMS